MRNITTTVEAAGCRSMRDYEAGCIRLEQIVINQQTELGKLERKIDSLKAELEKKGVSNARLNKELDKLKKG